jgi:hypothetical protein
MAKFLAVAAGYSIRVSRLVALLCHVIGRAAVAAGPCISLGTLTGLSGDPSLTRENKTHITREVTHLVTLVAFHPFCRARLGALLGLMSLLLAVLASKGVHTLFRAVTGTVTFLMAVDALDDRLC